jgi:hypothetical protein
MFCQLLMFFIFIWSQVSSEHTNTNLHKRDTEVLVKLDVLAPSVLQLNASFQPHDGKLVLSTTHAISSVFPTPLKGGNKGTSWKVSVVWFHKRVELGWLLLRKAS